MAPNLEPRSHSSKRTYYLHRDGSVTNTPTPSHLLRIRAASQDEAALRAMALETMLCVAGIHLAFQDGR